ncbi:MAG TPA: hypothetical protein VGI31_02765, partial [Streptosporangiaceae bacterium]
IGRDVDRAEPVRDDPGRSHLISGMLISDHTAATTSSRPHQTATVSRQPGAAAAALAGPAAAERRPAGHFTTGLPPPRSSPPAPPDHSR